MPDPLAGLHAIGETKASPTTYSILDRLKALLTGITLASNTGVDIGDVDVLSIAAGTNRIGTVSGVLKEVRVVTVIDGGLGAYLAKDVVGNEDCCSTTATYMTFAAVTRANGTYGYIVGATLFNETENQAVQYDLHLFNAVPTGELRDNWPNTNPIKEDRAKYLGKIAFPSTIANGATVATTTQASPSTVGNLPMPFKTVTVDDIYGVLVTNTAYTPTAGDSIDITLIIEQY